MLIFTSCSFNRYNGFQFHQDTAYLTKSSNVNICQNSIDALSFNIIDDRQAFLNTKLAGAKYNNQIMNDWISNRKFVPYFNYITYRKMQLSNIKTDTGSKNGFTIKLNAITADIRGVLWMTGEGYFWAEVTGYGIYKNINKEYIYIVREKDKDLDLPTFVTIDIVGKRLIGTGIDRFYFDLSNDICQNTFYQTSTLR